MYPKETACSKLRSLPTNTRDTHAITWYTPDTVGKNLLVILISTLMHTHAWYPVILGWSVFRVIPKGNSICIRLTQSSISQSEIFFNFIHYTKPDGVVVKIYQCFTYVAADVFRSFTTISDEKKFTSDDAATWRSVPGVRILGHIHVVVHEVRVRLENKRSHIQMKCMVSWLGKIEIDCTQCPTGNNRIISHGMRDVSSKKSKGTSKFSTTMLFHQNATAHDSTFYIIDDVSLPI